MPKITIHVSDEQLAILDQMVANVRAQASRPEKQSRSSVVRNLVFFNRDAVVAKWAVIQTRKKRRNIGGE